MVPRSSLRADTWPWIGLWAATFALFAILYPWMLSFHIPGIRPFPTIGTPRFLVAVLGPALISSLFTFSILRKRYARAALMENRSLTLRDKLGPLARGLLFLVKNDPSALGMPWLSAKRSGADSDMAGVALQVLLQTQGQIWYTVWLFWRSEREASFRLAWTYREDHARLFIAQASADLGVPVLPDQPTVGQ